MLRGAFWRRRCELWYRLEVAEYRQLLHSYTNGGAHTTPAALLGLATPEVGVECC